MQTIEIGTIVFYAHREDDRPNGSYVSPAIVTRPWSQNGALNITVIPDCGTPFTVSSAIHAKTLNELAEGDRWISKEECQILRIDLSNSYLNPRQLMNDRIAIRNEHTAGFSKWLHPLTPDDAIPPISNDRQTEEEGRLPVKDQLDPGD